MNRKAQIDTAMAWIVFAFYALIIIFVMSLCGCATTCKKDIESGIATDTGGIAELRASEQLSAYLRTEMPPKDVIMDEIDALEDKGSLDLGLDRKKAKSFLEEHPEVYVGKSYGGFISALYVYREDGKARDAFDAVTRALFNRRLFSKGIRELNDGRLDDLYYTPIISVNYRDKDGYKELISADPLALSSTRYRAWAFKVLPTRDGNEVTVKLEMHGEEEALPRP